MCGFCGIRLCDPAGRVSDETLARMNATLVHRGPDGEGRKLLGRVGFGHRRLSIVDLEGGVQPLANEDETVWVAYNGEIYNFFALRRELEAAGHRFATRCDTEVLVHGFEEWGEHLPEHLEGMFAFAVYDTRSDRLLLARDRFGIKPLYHARRGNDLVFGSEIRALLASGIPAPQADARRIDAFLSLGYVPGRQTLFSGIEKLRPGHAMLLEGDRVREWRYYDLAAAPRFSGSYEEAKARFRELFAAAVESHLLSDVPLGVFLSGGVDSSAVVAFLREVLGREVATFSVGYSDDPRASELGHAKRVAERFSTDHHEFVLTHESFFRNTASLLDHSEEPLVESAAVALLDLSRQTAPFAKVLLSGEGSDEVFGGYDLYGRTFQLERLHRLLFPLRAAWARRAAGGILTSERMRKYLDWIGQSFTARYRSIPSDLTPSIRAGMYSEAFRSETDGFLDREFAGLFSEVEDRDLLARMQFADLKTWLVDDLLLKADKMTMAASIELRVPFLDRAVVEFGLGLPAAYKRRGGVGKALVKEVVSDYVPRDLLYRPKQGFPVPVDKWFRTDLYSRVSEILLSPRTLDRGYLRPEYVRRTLLRHRSGKENLGRRLFSLLVLELWHRRWIEGDELEAIRA